MAFDNDKLCSYCMRRKPTRMNQDTGEKVCEKCYEYIIDSWGLIKDNTSDKDKAKLERIRAESREAYLRPFRI